jgi:hypothetical protein
MERGEIRQRPHSWQSGRWMAALDPETFRLDERRLVELIAFANRFSKLLPFPGEPGDARGWEPFFTGDPARLIPGDISFIIAEIASVDASGEYLDAVGRLAEVRQDTLLEPIHHSLKRLNRWRDGLALARVRKGEKSVERALYAVVESLIEGDDKFGTSDLRVLVGCLDSNGRNKDYPRWNELRKDDGVDNDYWKPEPTGPERNPFTPPGPLEIYGLFNRTTRVIAERAEVELQASLEQSDHAPHAALMLSFLSLFSRVQADANRITGRHLDYYFRTVLRLSERPSEPDRAHVYFTPAPQAAPFVLERGAQLSAGSDATGAPILFGLDHGVEISAVEVARVASLYLERTQGDGDAPGAVASILARPVANSEDGFGAPLADPAAGWSPFGVGADGGPAENSVQAEIGLIIRSRFLLLRAGARRLTVTLNFASGAALARSVRDYVAATRKALSGPAAQAIPDEAIVASAFRFTLEGTADDRRLEAAPNLSGIADGRLAFVFTFDSAAPPLAGPAQPNAPGAPVAFPALRITFNPASETRVFAYSHFRGLRIAAVGLDVAVSGLAPLTLQTSAGAVDASKPFLPFGPLAPCGAWLVFHHPDLFWKTIDTLTLKLQWSGLPAPPDTVEAVYAGYAGGLTSESFRGSLSVLSDYRWTPVAPAGAAQGDSPSFPLFDFDGNGLAQPTSWSFGLAAFAAAAPPARALVYDQTCRAGFYRLTLTDPPMGFGQQVYPGLLTSTVMQNAAAPDSKPKPLPAAPIAPTVAAIAVDYVSRAELAVERAPTGKDPGRDEGVYSFGPFGLRTDIVDFLAFPDFGEDGYLLIGVARLPPSRAVSLLFHVEASAADCFVTARNKADETGANPVLKLRYFSGLAWKEFAASNVTQDTTESLSRSGIIGLQLPLDAAGSPAPGLEQLIWLQISVNRPGHYGRIIDIRCQAATATRVGALAAGAGSPILPPNAITGLVRKNANILAVVQPFATERGRLAEDERQFRIRVSERLRHKQRAVLPRDYESLILENFPGIGDAKCLTREEAGWYGAPSGDVVIVVAPLRIRGAGVAEPRAPEYLLREIGAFLLDRCPASVERIRVRNPEYEPVRVSAWLDFGPGGRAELLQQVRRAVDRRIAPWREDETLALPIGVGQVDLADLLTVLGDLDCDPEVRGLSLAHFYRDPAPLTPLESQAVVFNRVRDSARPGFDQNKRMPWWPWSVLVPAADHRFQLLDGPTGIDVLGLEDDFVVGWSAHDAYRPPAKAGIGNLEVDVDLLVQAGIGNLAIQDDFLVG